MAITKIEDLPILESTQFQFISTSPINSELIALTNTSKYQENLFRTPQKDWTRNMNMARELHNNPRYAPVINAGAIEKYGHERAINCFRYLCVFIKQVKIRPIDHVAIINWFIDGELIDVEKTIELYNIKI